MLEGAAVVMLVAGASDEAVLPSLQPTSTTAATTSKRALLWR
jgi:hypothetical protein